LPRTGRPLGAPFICKRGLRGIAPLTTIRKPSNYYIHNGQVAQSYKVYRCWYTHSSGLTAGRLSINRLKPRSGYLYAKLVPPSRYRTLWRCRHCSRVLFRFICSSTRLGSTSHGTTGIAGTSCSTYLKPDCPARTTALSGA